MYNRQLVTFIQVADSKSFSKASEKLFISTVAVMKQINALEESLGVKLFDRTSKGAALTAAGRSAYQDAREIIRLSEQAIRRAREAAGMQRHTIRIGSSRLHPHTILHDRLSALDPSLLPFHIQIVPFYEENIGLHSKLKMLGKEFDCVIAPCNFAHREEDFSFFHLQSVPLRLSLPRSHRLAGKGHLSLEDLHGESLLLHARGIFAEFDALRDMLQARHPEISLIDVPAYDTEVFNLCARKNYLMITLDIWQNIHPSLTARPVSWDLEAQLGLIYEKEPSRAMLEFIERLR